MSGPSLKTILHGAVQRATQSISKLEREQVAVVEYEPESYFLTGEAADVGALLPPDALVDGITEQFIGVFKRESGEWVACGILDFDSQATGGRRSIVQ